MTREHQDEPITVTDNRRIDPETGAARGSGDPAPEAATVPATDAPAAEPAAQESDPTAELTADLQRLQADFTNYRRRAEKEKQSSIQYGKGLVLTELIGVLDDLDRARSHGDLESGPLKAVADKLADVANSQGLQAFGAPGDAFDPALHEAVQHEGSGDSPVVGTVYRQGYRFGDRVLRTAMVVVSDGPAEAQVSDDAAAESSDSGTAE